MSAYPTSRTPAAIWLTGVPVPSSRAQRPEGGAELFGEELGLFPGCEVAASVDLVVMDEVVRVGALGPAPRCLVQLVREHADGERDRDLLGVEEVRFVLPVETGRGYPGVGQPVERDVVKQVVPREVAVESSLEGLLDQAGLSGPVAVVQCERREIDGRVGQPVKRLRTRGHDQR